jgi:penicillin amidase
MRRRAARAVVVLLLLAVAVAGAGGWWWIRDELVASLPVLDGRVTIAGLHAPVSITRDALGIPTIRGQSRQDVARATGFLHAQDRFFQMDLARRRAAGELAELVGARALPLDRLTRMHRFRAEARRAVTLLPDRDRQILRAYVDGVNAGLDHLGAPPFEYLLLRQTPARWREEDTFLVVLSMFLTLQDSDGTYDSTIATMHELLPAAMVDFLVPPGSEWDSPVEGEAFAVPPIPGPEVYNLRARRIGKPPIELPPPRPEPINVPTPNAHPPVLALLLLGWTREEGAVGSWGGDSRWELGVDQDAAIGSNNFAVAGGLTGSGAALLANDMHLAVRVPNTWYRAVYAWTDSAAHLLVGATLPGHPAMVIGSNTQVAWGFTNTYGDFADVVPIEQDSRQPDRYRTPEGWQRFEHYDEVINVSGGDPEHLAVTWTRWGPLIAPDFKGRPRALSWVAHSAERLASEITLFESADTLDAAFDEANGLGVPGQNMLAADRSGRIGWSIFGAIPRRVGSEGDVPVSWADGTAGWDGWLTDAEYPRIIDPPAGRLWSANARVASAERSRPLGHGNWEIGSRARIIRDRLFARERFSTRDLLDVQLDISARFLERWRDLLLRTLTPDALRDHPARAELRDVVNRLWSHQVTADSAAYRLTRMFRDRVSERVFGFLLTECYEADPEFDYRAIRLREGPIWKVVTEQPLHLLDPEFATWQQLLLASADEVVERVRTDDPGPLSERTWGEFNQTVYRHPLSGALPFLWRWLDMPAQALPGDLYTPNMHWGMNAPSERMIVSPGREQEGMMHMPTGQSGHPMSPYYANSHPAWVNGEMTPLMPGPTEHTLTLVP